MESQGRAARLIVFFALALLVLGCTGSSRWGTGAGASPVASAATSPVASAAGSDGASAPAASGPSAPAASVGASPSAGSAAGSPAASPAASPTGAALGADASAVEVIRAAAHPLTGAPDEYDALIAELGKADIVLLGEPSHGSHEVYVERAEITRRLIEEAGFSGVVIEGDWPDARRVDRYVRGLGDDATAVDALGAFDEFPLWMWRNEAFAELVAWLHDHNASLPYERDVGVYGMDVYSLTDSIQAVPLELESLDPTAAAQIASRYECAGASGRESARDDAQLCAQDVREALRQAIALADAVPPGDMEQADLAFSAAQNARVVVNARRYELGEGGPTESGWNIRDRHMVESVAALRDHLLRTGRTGRLVVWAHNSHIGDARATEVAAGGQVNLGQLVREQQGVSGVLVGFSTYAGTVTAAHNWGEEPVTMDVRPALPDSHHGLLHEVSQAGAADFLVFLGSRAPAPLQEERLERFIGVLYLPETERFSHYLETRLAEQYDVLIHLDRTTAVRPLDESP